MQDIPEYWNHRKEKQKQKILRVKTVQNVEMSYQNESSTSGD